MFPPCRFFCLALSGASTSLFAQTSNIGIGVSSPRSKLDEDDAASGTGELMEKFLAQKGAAGAQEFSGSIAPQFHDIEMSNGTSAAINITNLGGVSIGGTPTFPNSVKTTLRNPATNGELRSLAGASFAGTLSDTRHVDGYVGKIGNTALSIPVGDGAQYRPFTFITPPSVATDAVNVDYFSGDPAALDPTGGAHEVAARQVVKK